MTKDLYSFAAEYFRVRRALRDDASREERVWVNGPSPSASSELMDLLDVDPTEAWHLTLALIERAPGEEALAYVAAGPLEDLIGRHGRGFADRIVAEAQANARPSDRPQLRLGLEYAPGRCSIEAARPARSARPRVLGRGAKRDQARRRAEPEDTLASAAGEGGAVHVTLTNADRSSWMTSRFSPRSRTTSGGTVLED